MRKAYSIILTVFLVGMFAILTLPQSGGTFVIQKSVIAGGGGDSTGGTFILDGTIGEPFAGETSAGGTFSVAGGFWNAGAAASGSPTPPAITGTVTYGNALGNPPAPRFVSNVLITGAGSPNVSTTTTFPNGTYSLTGFGAGSYTVTPTKVGAANGAITSFDAAKISQHVAGTVLLTGNQLLVADVSGNGQITSFDAAQIAQFVAGTGSGMLTGSWKFSPVNRGYASVSSNISGEDYTALLMGEVSGNWTNTGARPVISSSNGPENKAAISAPRLTAPADREVNVPISVQGVDDKGIIAYQFEIRYDPSVIQPMTDPVGLLGTVSNRLSAASHAEKEGLLRVAVYGAVPINSNGVLINLRFMAVGAPGAVSPLTWKSILLNEGDPQTTTADGQVELSPAPPTQAEISGRVLTAMGQGVSNARVTLADTAGKSRSVVSNSFGVYHFADLQMGQSYTIRVESQRYRFTPLTVSVTGQLGDIDMIAEQ